MSLGLGDLKSKPRTLKSDSKSKSSTLASQEQTWNSKSAKPWDANGLKSPMKSSKSRKKPETDELFMNIEWAASPSIHFADFETLKEEKIAQLQDVVRSFETKIKRATSGPFKILSSVLKIVQK